MNNRIKRIREAINALSRQGKATATLETQVRRIQQQRQRQQQRQAKRSYL